MRKFIKEVSTNEYTKLNYGNRYLIDTFHSIERYQDDNRFNNLASTQEFKNKIVEITNKATHKILSKYNDKSARYAVHSNSTGMGIIIDWRLDKKRINNFNNAILVTILPIKNYHYIKPSDIPVVVESILKDWYEIEEGYKVRNSYGTCDHHLKAYNEDQQIDSSYYALRIVFFEGKLQETDIDEWIFLE